jgi:hypothetical protein
MDATLGAMPFINYISTDHNSLRSSLTISLTVLKMTIASPQVLSHLAKVKKMPIREKKNTVIQEWLGELDQKLGVD